MKTLWAGVWLVCMFAGAAVAAEAPNCTSAKTCDAMGGKAYRAKDFAAAAALYEQQAGWVDQDSRDCEAAHDNSQHKACPDLRSDAFNNAALAWLRAGEPLKARAWLAMAPASPSTTHNKGLVAAALASSAKPTSPAGEYWEYAGFGTWNTITVSANGKQFDVQFSGMHYGGNGMKYGPNTGDLADTVTVKDHHAVMHGDGDSPTCKVDLKFTADGVDADQDGDCGFGAGVGAIGHFDRVTFN